MKRCALASVIVLSSGCATLTTGSTDTVTVDTRPPGATCELTQSGTKLAFINPTPGSIQVPKSTADLSVLCRKTGYLDSSGVLSSEFQAMTFGNLLFGGLVGVVVDAASGAMNQYPPIVTLTLQPESFPSAEARDQFFNQLREDFLNEYEETLARIRNNCRDDQFTCDSRVKAAEDGREEKLREIEALRQSAVVRPPAESTG